MPSDHFWFHLEPKAERARLDADGKAKPKTRIVSHVKVHWCVGPGTPLHNPEYETETGERISLK